MKLNLREFVRIADQQVVGKGTNEDSTAFIRENKGSYSGLKTEISFGMGRASAVPWIAFTGFNQNVKNGIYPVYLYYKEHNILILAYGVSETNQPLISWELDTRRISITEFFTERLSRTPPKYGGSFIFKVYNANNLPAEEIIESDLQEIIQKYIQQFVSASTKRNGNDEFSVTALLNDLSYSNLLFSDHLVKRFTAALATKPFVIFSGLSGSGKTKLAQAFVQWLCQDKSQYCLVPVGADWTNREPLLGYPNALEPDHYVEPDNGVLRLIMKANERNDLPFFLILDEMNLSHVERYFSDFLSVMESGDEIPLHSKDAVKNGVPKRIALPPNFFIIGTVNIDETTSMFSPKVLDRANTIEFRISELEMQSFLANIQPINMGTLTAKGAAMAGSFLDLAKDRSFTVEQSDDIQNTLIRFFGELKKAGAEFGYRTATEILRLISRLGFIDETLTPNQKIDIAIIQKLLPKLHGSRRKLTDILITLATFCVKDGVRVEDEFMTNGLFDIRDDRVLYPLSLEKIIRMYRSAIDNGFTSFAEA